MFKSDLSIIIVNYNTEKKALRCLDSIEKSDLENINYEVIIVDNNSKENLKNFLEKEVVAEKVKIIFSKINLGMGGGNNLGIRHANGKLILILNPDTIVKKGALKLLYNFISSREDIGILGPKILNIDLSRQNSCFRFPNIFMPFLRRTFLAKLFSKKLNQYLLKDKNLDKITEVDWLMGSCLLFRRKDVEKLKVKKGEYFDERFFMYFEDIDLCRRFKEAGFKIIYNPDAEIIHDHTRASYDGKWYLAFFHNKLAREHIKSYFKYFFKWKIQKSIKNQ